MSSYSIWKDKAEETSFSPLRQDITADVAIVGGGITGLTAAYILSRAGKKVAVLEARKIGEGSTGSSTGNLYCTIGSPGLHNVKSKFNEKKIKEVVESRAAAADFIEQRVKEFNIDCDFKRVPWSLFTEDSSGQSFVEKEKKLLRRQDLPLLRISLSLCRLNLVLLSRIKPSLIPCNMLSRWQKISDQRTAVYMNLQKLMMLRKVRCAR